MPKRMLDLRAGEPSLDIVSYGRGGPRHRDRLSPAPVQHIARMVRRVPEVMVKVSGGGRSPEGVTEHLRYISRRGRLEIETDEGERLQGRGVSKDLASDWDLEADVAQSRSPCRGTPGRKPSKLVHNIILSMPAGTPPDRLMAAARDFAREQFGLRHRYAMVLHTDQEHPHVHLVVKVLSEQGERLNIRKATLREWRQEFARHLRAYGVAANATERAVRGVSRPRKSDGIYRAMRDPNRYSTHMQERAESVAAALLAGDIKVEPGKSKLLKTRADVVRGWRALSHILASEGYPELAAQIRRFVDTMPPPRTEREWIAHKLLSRVHEAQTLKQLPAR